MDREIWKDVVGFEGLYKVSNLGNVKSLITNKILAGGTAREYKVVPLRKNNTPYMKYIHRLVALAFIPKVENKNCINHKNGIKTDNRVDNLEWVTQKENIEHSWKIGLSTSKEHKVVQKKNGVKIGVYKNPREAARKLKISPSPIYKCLSQNYYSKTAGGFEWEWL